DGKRRKVPRFIKTYVLLGIVICIPDTEQWTGIRRDKLADTPCAYDRFVEIVVEKINWGRTTFHENGDRPKETLREGGRPKVGFRDSRRTEKDAHTSSLIKYSVFESGVIPSYSVWVRITISVMSVLSTKSSIEKEVQPSDCRAYIAPSLGASETKSSGTTYPWTHAEPE